MRHTQRLFVLTLSLLLAACSQPTSGPDKTLSGALLGAGWGAGAGAVVGHQLSYAGEGAAIGAGFGLVSGALSGGGYDLIESTQVRHQEELAALQVQSAINFRELQELQYHLDRAIESEPLAGVYQVFFDGDATTVRSGAVANLEIIAETIRKSPAAYIINVVGHSDDSGAPEYNARLAEARARAVASYLSARGLSLDRIVVKSFGSQRPIASNATPEGRQLNRRVDVYISRE